MRGVTTRSWCLLRHLLTLGLLLSFSTEATALDLAHRLGLGYASNISPNLLDLLGGDSSSSSILYGNHAFSAKYWVTPEMGVQGTFGMYAVNSAADLFALNAGGRFLYNLIQRDYSNLYIGTGVGLIFGDISPAANTSQSDPSTNNDGIFLCNFQGVAGVEFMIPRLDDISFNFEAGLNLGFGSVADEFTFLFSFVSSNFVSGGIHYYF
jgi:hypothetical protein